MSQVAIVDLGTGNLRSVEQAIKHVAPDQQVVITADPKVVVQADRMVLPGQGAVGTWFKAYQQQGLDAAVRDALKHKPCFAICVGMQALFEYCAEDGGMNGLGLFSGRVEHFAQHHLTNDVDTTARVKIPHMGWNIVQQVQEHPVWHKIDDEARFYFLHSYAATSNDMSCTLGLSDYHQRFIAMVGRDNVVATQFHPEKSHENGLQLLRNFVRWDGQVS